MDFELNQKFCTGRAHRATTAQERRHVTPNGRGDKLITYDLSKGGTVPAISIRTWRGSAWGPATWSAAAPTRTALGAVNTSADRGRPTSGGIGALDPFTFGEAAISFQALFGGTTGAARSARPT